MVSRVRPIEKENLGQRARWALRDALLEGRFRPGERLRLRDIAEEMGISVTPVREAVLQLVQEGALTLRSQRDIRVRELSVEEYLEAVDIRKFLEGEAVERFVGLMTPQDLTALERLEERHQSAIDRSDYRSAVSLDRQFMFTIFAGARMPLFLEILDRLWLLARPTVTLLYNDAGAALVDLGNGRLLEKLATGDARGAVTVRRENLDACARVIVNILESAQSEQAAANG